MMRPRLRLSSFPRIVVPMPNPAPITTLLHATPDNSGRGLNSFVPTKWRLWNDAIIDDMFANPGTTVKATAERLGRSPVTVGYIINSDLFKARYAQRRDQFNEDLDQRLVGKLAKVAELSLDLTMEQLEKKRTAVPLPLLNDIMSKSLDRLGYGPKTAPATAVQVNVNNSSPTVAVPVSAAALEEARASLRQVESGRLAARQEPLLIEGSAAVENETLRSPAVGGGPPEDLL